MKYLYRLYQLVICLPILLLASILTSLTTVLGCMLGNGHFWGYYPGKCWAWLWVRILLLPVKVEPSYFITLHYSVMSQPCKCY